MTWKKLTHTARVQLADTHERMLVKRLNQGHREYGENYQGVDPTDDVVEELLDALIYMQWVKKQRLSVLYLLSDIVENEMAEPAAAEVARQAISIINGEDGP